MAIVLTHPLPSGLTARLPSRRAIAGSRPIHLQTPPLVGGGWGVMFSPNLSLLSPFSPPQIPALSCPPISPQWLRVRDERPWGVWWAGTRSRGPWASATFVEPQSLGKPHG